MRTVIIALALGLLSTPLLAVNKDAAEFGGSCAWGMAEFAADVPTDCSVNWTDPATKKTYCFSSEQSKQAFLKNPQENSRKARENAAEVQKKQ